MRVFVRLVVVGLMAVAITDRGFGQEQARCEHERLPGFKAFEDISWEGPWVYDAKTRAPLTSFERSQAVPLRRDDGSTATVRIRAAECKEGEPCDPPPDCGCLRNDRYVLSVENAAGREIIDRRFWAAYGLLSIIPVDLVGGAGDELIIVRVPARSSPPSGRELKIWRIGTDRVTEIGPPESDLARGLATTPVRCAQWRKLLSIDRQAPAPRSISVRTELGSTGCCEIFPEGRGQIEALRQPAELRFDETAGRFNVVSGRH